MSNRAESVLVGLIGEGVMPSLTPPMHEREADVQGLRLLYRPIDLLDLALPATAVGDLLTAAGRMGFNGLNITHPCKQLVLQHLDEVSDDADRLGAVNTVLIRDGRFIGHNTDFSGFGSALTDGLSAAKLDRVVQLGAGGAGSAVAYALLKAGVKHLDLVDMDASRAAERATELSGLFPVANITAHTPADLKNVMPLADGLVHCTPIGMAAHPGLPLDIELLEPRHWVADIVYRPIETQLVREARAKGCDVLDGGRMAVGQAADAFKLFTGKDADRDRMREHFLELIATEESALVKAAH
ncbi:shikimate dehydrogenase [Arthrobacter sp. TES]|jgi:shikimate dehydrogenase|uniref:shikimate dehydrogenase n=1 Tax=Paenarthrobacter TaxID=1742992 RepID=UPI00039864EA|nr:MULTISPECIES: shikimate dehydrogenase [Paenarthrobacter]QOI65090.1 shikimate dehydrogenase [Arthrobacter sp. TES]QOT15348.1 shikimate dehydrogenase [Paenarthrobacter sp. YJN-5]GLU61491.1 shikimate dehydrogenase [Paenarthrobacter ureafaciens]GLU65757.1 shikimate dehydrogenase [Paenarthrobacter ureafaciens]GLU70070.1 shikimate dehydrogenase [Paenarthrobacter ureafaciens]